MYVQSSRRLIEALQLLQNRSFRMFSKITHHKYVYDGILPAYAMDHEIITYEVYPRTYLVTQ